MNLQKLTEQFWHDGYLFLDRYFDPELMDQLDQLIVDHFGVDPEMFHNEEFITRAKTEVIPWFPQEEGVSAFDKIESDAALAKLTEHILGAGWKKLYCMVMFSKKGTNGQAWHQDCPPEDPSMHNLNRLVYTSGIVSRIGGEVMVVPGSHKRGELTIGDPNEVFDDQVVLYPRKGSLLLLHGHTWHRVGAIKDGYRFSVNYRSMPARTQPDITDVCVYRNMRYQFSTNKVIVDRMAAEA